MKNTNLLHYILNYKDRYLAVAVIVAALMTLFFYNMGQPVIMATAADNTGKDVEIDMTADFDSSLISFLENNGFGESNYMVSPTSFKAAMALAVAGADSETKEQLLSALGFKNTDELNEWYESVDASVQAFNAVVKAPKEKNSDNEMAVFGLGGGAPEGSFKMLNSIWHNADRGGDFSKSYKESVLATFNAKAENLPSGELTGAVNDWVDKGTDGLISRIADDLSAIDVVLINTLYLRSAWVKDFDEAATHEDEFKTLKGNTVKKDFMEQQAFFNYYEADNGKAAILPLYGQVNVVLMLGDSIELQDVLDKSQSQMVHVKLPKFEADTTFCNSEFVNYLSKRGAELPFTSSADFSKMSDDTDLFISDIIQKTRVKFDEKGVEAAAATAVMALGAALPGVQEVKEFVADEPFRFMIVTDSENPEVLFYGRIVE